MLKRQTCSFALSLLLLCGGAAVTAQAAQESQQSDNTKINKQQGRDSQPTADTAKNGMSDRELMAHIRREVVKDKALSTYGKNVKIIATHGKVTLKGPVHTEDEKKSIEAYAEKFAGAGNVDDQLTVKGDKK